MLEDCILNGRLRDLEIRIREGWVRGMKSGEGEEGRNWRCLRRLLRDPYLERSVLMAGPLERAEAYEVDGNEVKQMAFQHVVWIFDNSAEGVWRKIA